MSWFSNLTGGGSSYKNPADAAQPYFEQMPSYISKYEDPYINYGLNAGAQNANQFSKMATDPTGYYNDLYSTYEPSDSYQYNSDKMAETASNTAAAGGYSGTDSDIEKQTEQQNALLDQDWQQYLNNVLGIQGTGLQGNQSFYNTGFQASNTSLDDYLGMLNAEAGLAYNSTSQENSYNQAQQNALLGALGKASGSAAYGFLG